jgi:tetratricopeptide (TPR) repeat protein
MTQNNATPSQTSGKRKTVILIIGLTLAVMFLTSFLYRTMKPDLLVERRAAPQTETSAGTQGQGEGMPQDMPPAMQEAMQQEIGKLMRKMQENPEDVATLLELANYFMNMQSWDKAQVFLNNAVVLKPADIEILYRLGICSFQLEQPAEAAGYFEQIVALEPEHAHALYNLGVLYKHYLDKPDEAKKLFTDLVAIADAPQDLLDAGQKELATGHAAAEAAREDETPPGDTAPEAGAGETVQPGEGTTDN